MQIRITIDWAALLPIFTLVLEEYVEQRDKARLLPSRVAQDDAMQDAENHCKKTLEEFVGTSLLDADVYRRFFAHIERCAEQKCWEQEIVNSLRKMFPETVPRRSVRRKGAVAYPRATYRDAPH